MTWFSALFLIIFKKSAPVRQLRTFHVATLDWFLCVMSSLVAPPHWSITNLLFLIFFVGKFSFFPHTCCCCPYQEGFFSSIL